MSFRCWFCIGHWSGRTPGGNQNDLSKVEVHNCCIAPRQASAQRIKPKLQPRTTFLICFTLTVCRRTRSFRDFVRCCAFFGQRKLIWICREDPSALNKIIHNSQFNRRISLEEQKAQKEDRFLRGRQIAYLIYEQFRVTGTDSSVETYTDLFTIALRNDDIQEFDSKWVGILLSVTKIPHDDTLEGLNKLRIRESEKLKTVLELYDLEIHQKKWGPDYHRLKTMVKKEVSSKKFEIRILG